MSYNGSGTFQINTSGQPVVAGTVISSTAFNALTADLATGLSTAITKDGQTTATARIPFAAGISSTLVTDSSSVSTGSIITAGGVGIAKALYVGTLANIGTSATIGTTLTVTGSSTFTGSIAVDSVTDSSSTTTGSIQTDGGLGVAKAVYVGTTANVAGAVTLQSTLGVTGVATLTAQPILSSLTASSAVATDASKGLVSVTNTGTGNNVLATAPTIASLNLTTALTLASASGTVGQVLTSGGSGNAPTWSSASATSIVNGTSNVSINSSNGAITASTNGTSAFTIDTSQNFQFNSGYGSVATAYGCRAWVNFNGTGTVAIRGSGNVSSITDNGAGDYTLNFTTALPDGNYAPVISSNNTSSNTSVSNNNDYSSVRTTTAYRFGHLEAAALADASVLCVAIFR